MNKQPLVLTFKHLKIDFSKVDNYELLEKIFKAKPVPYFPTLLYIYLFNICYKNFVDKADDSFSLVTSYKELRRKFDYNLSTLSNALASLKKAKLISKERVMVPNDNPDSNLRWKYVLNITLKLSPSTRKSLQK